VPVVDDVVPVVDDVVPVVDDVVPVDVPVVPAPYITTMDELMSMREAVLQKEASDRAALMSVLAPSPEALRQALYAWALRGFPPMSTLFSAAIFPPSVCSDNTARDIAPYMEYLNGSQPIASLIQALEERVEGINFSYNVVQFNVLSLVVIKT